MHMLDYDNMCWLSSTGHKRKERTLALGMDGLLILGQLSLEDYDETGYF